MASRLTERGVHLSARLHSAFKTSVGVDAKPGEGPQVSGELTFVVGVGEDVRTPQMFLETLNLVFDPSDELGGGATTPSASLPGGEPIPIDFDPGAGELAAKFEIGLDIPSWRNEQEREYDPLDHAPGPGPVTATATIEGRFVNELDPTPNRIELLDAHIRIEIPELLGEAVAVPVLELHYVFPLYWFRFTPARQLCIQPVFIAANGSTPPTGADFYPGLRRANELWAPCCIEFVAKCPPIYIDKQQYRISTENEARAFKDEVNVADAIEVFIVERFDPEDTWGGGVTFGSGTAGAKIVSGDNQLPLNENHMAHELGHVIGLIHPGDARPGVVAGCDGSLMEPSGFFADNPDFQCEGNCNNASNPLLCSVPHRWCFSWDRPDDQLFLPAGT